MNKIVGGVAAIMVLALLAGIVLTALGKFLIGLALVLGLFLIVGVCITAFTGNKIWNFWKSF